MGISRWALACVVVGIVACNTGDNSVDPSDLGLRDLLGLAPDVATAWTSAQRAAGRRVLLASLRAPTSPADDAPFALAWPARAGGGGGGGGGGGDGGGGGEQANRAAGGRAGGAGAQAEGARAQAASGAQAAGARAQADADSDVQPIADALAARDTQRAAAGAEPFAVVRVDRAADHLTITPRVALHTADAVDAVDGHADRAAPSSAQIMLDANWDASARWAHLPGRGLDVLAALAADAQHPGGPIIVVAAPRLTVIAAYLADATPRLAVNPVLLAALEPGPDEATTTAGLLQRSTTTPAATRAPLVMPAVLPAAPPDLRSTPERTSVAGGNPYSFYGSFEECAQAQRRRCEACLPGHTCEPVTDTSDGNAECTQLAANSGRGYFLLCINLSLAISSVNDCTGSAAPSCARATRAADSLATLDANTDFLDDSACAGALDHCLAKIYGAPDQPFPGLTDGGTIDAGAAPPPRSTSESCGNGCSNNNANCEASPTVDCTGPSCNNSLSCDTACASSNNQSGCNGNDNSCASDGNGNGGSCGSGGGDCGTGSGSGGGSGGGGGCDKGSGSGSGGGCGGGSGGGCGSGSGGGCGGGSGGGCGGSGGGCGGGSGGGSKCSASPADPTPGVAIVMSLMWGLLPIPFAAATRRRAHRRLIAPPAAAGLPDGDAGAVSAASEARADGEQPGSANSDGREAL